MRALMSLTVLCVLVPAAGIRGQLAPTCDGTQPKTGKCENGTVPTGYYEASTCQGDLPGSVSCLHAIAFNIEAFYCTAPQLDKSRTPPSYTTYCADQIMAIECTNQRQCSGVVMFDGQGKQFTKCSLSGTVAATYKLPKYTRVYDEAPNTLNRCNEAYPQP